MDFERLNMNGLTLRHFFLQIAIVLIVANVEISTVWCNNGNYVISGQVLDRESGQPIAGVTLRDVENRRGTYSSSSGKFRMPMLAGKHKLKVSSLGYESLRIDVDDKQDTLIIKLKPLPVSLKGVEVTSEIDVDVIIKRAILQKTRNLNKIKTFTGLLYSKLVMELDGSLLAMMDGNGGSISGSIGGSQNNSEMKYLVMETFSRNYSDFTRKKSTYEIIQRHQTANIKPQNNLLAFGNFLSFYGETIKLVNAEMPTPLNKDALDFYKFTLKEKKMLDERYVYIISVQPRSSTYPALKGTISIVEGTYNLIEADLSPSQASAIPLMKDIRFVQKFEEIEKNVWYPTFLESTGKADIEVVAGLISFQADIKATSIFSEMQVNVAIPDSVFKEKPTVVTVAPGADSTDISFWKENSLRDISPRELTMYSKIDSIVKKKPITDEDGASFDYKILNPYFDFNRVGSISLGLSPSFSSEIFDIETDADYSFGQKRFFGRAGFVADLFSSENVAINIDADIFSTINTMSNDETFSRLINSAMVAFLKIDNYGYYRSDGWSAGINMELLPFNIWISYESSRQSSLKQTTNRSIFASGMRPNPAISNGAWNSIKANLSFGKVDFVNIRGNVQYEFSTHLAIGQEYGQKSTYKSIEVKAELLVPTFKTGYIPMMLGLIVHAGVQSKETPLQNMFRMLNNLSFLGVFGNFSTTPIAKYGGNEFLAVHANFNTGDLWWRAIGLPTFLGRGIDLNMGVSTGLFNSKRESFYTDTQNQYYTEAGFGLSRIPTFISNVAYLGCDVKWGIGNIAHGNFGWSLTLSLPF